MALALIEKYLDLGKKYEHELAEVTNYNNGYFLLPSKRKLTELIEIDLNKCIIEKAKENRDNCDFLFYWCDSSGIFQYKIVKKDNPKIKGVSLESMGSQIIGPMYNLEGKKLDNGEIRDILEFNSEANISRCPLKAAQIYRIRLPLKFSIEKLLRFRFGGSTQEFSLSKVLKKAFFRYEDIRPYSFDNNPYFYPIKKRSCIEGSLSKIPVEAL